MALTDEQRVEICKYYENNPNRLGATHIVGYDNRDVANLLISIAGSGGLTMDKVEDYRRRIEAHFLQRESNVIQEKGISYKRIIIVIILTAIITNIDRITKFIISLFNK